MLPARPLLLSLALLLLCSRALSAALGGHSARNISAFAGGISLTHAIPSDASIASAVAGARPKHGPPGEDADPHGVRIYNSLEDVPTGRLLSQARAQGKCPRAETARCWAAYVCGHRCEQILLAVEGFCRRGGGAGKGARNAAEVEWKRCQKARKFNRCYARVCFRRRWEGGGGRQTPRPKSYEDVDNVAIVRYRRPLPKHEVLAKRNRQSSTQSAIFK